MLKSFVFMMAEHFVQNQRDRPDQRQQQQSEELYNWAQSCCHCQLIGASEDSRRNDLTKDEHQTHGEQYCQPFGYQTVQEYWHRFISSCIYQQQRDQEIMVVRGVATMRHTVTKLLIEVMISEHRQQCSRVGLLLADLRLVLLWHILQINGETHLQVRDIQTHHPQSQSSSCGTTGHTEERHRKILEPQRGERSQCVLTSL
mmetsp:Transcript_138291/g.265326  ORF Transcript_138291/g.265326 Transcript_138291/m.265326 type:complete len:201 (-) Transcript_138291:223-825(-)